MVDTGIRLPPWNLSFDGTLVCPPDIWGNRFSPTESWVDLHTNFLDWKLAHKTTMIAGTLVDETGQFNLSLTNHWRIIPSNSYYLEIRNVATGQIHSHKTMQIAMAGIVHVGSSSHVDVKEIQVPWTPVVPVIARVNGRELKYPADVARSLAMEFKSFNSTTKAELIQSFGGQPDPETNLDSMLAVIEADGRGSATPSKCLKFLDEVARSLRISPMQIHNPSDIVKLGFERCENLRFNTENIKDFSAFRLDVAARSAFGVSPFFLGLRGRAAFSLALFAAGSVVSGKRISVSALDNGTAHITLVSA